jgi:SPP1 gp7 family putative phage head morphogenesis protein
MSDKGKKTPLDSGLIARASGALRAVLGRDTSQEWFGPLSPMPPQVPEAQKDSVRGRAMDFPVGFNTRAQPRAGESVTFEQMRALADSCDILRLVIETRKDQMAKFKFAIMPVKDNKEKDARCEEVEAFFRLPDGETSWNTWLRMLIEEMLVTDAATIYPWLKNGGAPYRFELMDGATIKRVIDARGRTPAPPATAYQQILKGVPAADYTAEELVYSPRNRRSHKVYGYSPVEQIIMTVNIAIRRGLHQLQYYTDGSTPDLLFQVPPEWNMTQIKEFNDWWQDTLAGNTSTRRRAQFVPHGVTPINTKDAILKDPYDEWLARVICYAFNVSAQAFIKENNRSTSETAHQMALEEGLYPVMLWVKEIIDLLIWRYFGYTDLEFKWEDQDSTDPKDQNEMDDRNVKNGTATINEIRKRRGDKPVEGGDVAMVLTASGYVPIIPKEPVPDQLVPGSDPAEEDPEDPNDPKGTGKKPEDGKPAANKDVLANDKGSSDTSGKEAVAKAGYRFREIRKAHDGVKPIDRDSKEHRANLAAFQKAVADKLKSIGKDLADSVVSKVHKAGKQLEPDDLDWSRFEEFQDLFGKQLVTAAKKGVTDAYLQINLESDAMLQLANEDAIAYAAERSAELVGKRIGDDGTVIDNPNPAYSIEDATREMVRADITTAMEQGLSNDELAGMLRENYAFSEARAENIARTETATADCAGNKMVYVRSGVVGDKKWIVGDGCCPDCEALEGEVVGLEEPFSNGVQHPPGHPGCRCDFVPIINSDA